MSTRFYENFLFLNHSEVDDILGFPVSRQYGYLNIWSPNIFVYIKYLSLLWSWALLGGTKIIGSSQASLNIIL